MCVCVCVLGWVGGWLTTAAHFGNGTAEDIAGSYLTLEGVKGQDGQGVRTRKIESHVGFGWSLQWDE